MVPKQLVEQEINLTVHVKIKGVCLSKLLPMKRQTANGENTYYTVNRVFNHEYVSSYQNNNWAREMT